MLPKLDGGRDQLDRISPRPRIRKDDDHRFHGQRKSNNALLGMLQFCVAAITLGNVGAIKTTTSKRPKVTGKLAEKEVDFLMDTGASVSVVSEEIFNSLWGHWSVKRLPLPKHIRITGVTGHAIRIVDYVEVEIQIMNRKMSRPMLVVSGLHMTHAILGYDTIREEGMVIDGAKNKVTFSEEMAMISSNWMVAELRATRDIYLEPRSVHKIKAAAIWGRRTIGTGVEGLCHPLPGMETPIWDAMVKTDDHREITLAMVNTTRKSVLLPAGTQVGTMWNPEETGESIEPLNEETVSSIFGTIGQDPEEPKRGEQETLSEEMRQKLEQKINIEAPDEWKQRYMKLIMQYHDVISKDKFDLGHSDVIKHVIRMKDSEPVHQRQFRIPFAHEKVIFDYVDELLKKGAIEISRSPYNSPIFCVAKKPAPDAAPDDPVPLRVVLDYRGVNAKSLPDRYSIKEVRECIDEIGRTNSKIFTTIDLTSGFWQQELEEESRQFTAFSVPGKGARYQWKVAPMGLQGSPASFARLMDFILREITGVLTYIDDVLLHTREHEVHLRQLEVVLLRLRKYGLKLNIRKTIFGADQVQYLGYTISEGGVTLSKDKLQAIRDAKPPTTTKQVREFMGLSNYFRFLIPAFSRRAAPLNALTRKDYKWPKEGMPQEAMAAFEDLKTALCQEPIVAFPRRDTEFTLQTDASQGERGKAGGLGAVLLQEQDGEMKVIAYASRGLLDHEKNYSAFLLEMAAAVWGIEHFDTYLIGRRFRLQTDHRPVEKVSKVHSKTLNRLQQLLLQHNFKVEYNPGAENSVADYLSRNAAEIGEMKLRRETPAKSIATNRQIARMQREEERTGAIIKYLEAAELPENPRMAMWVKQMADENCFLDDRVLWYKKKTATREVPIMWAPTKLRQPIIQAAHWAMEAGHGGTQRTAERIMTNYYWPGIHADVGEFIKRCQTCQLAKAKHPNRQPLKPLPICDAPNQRVHIDLVGPLRTTNAGNKFVMVITDAFTKYAEVAPIVNKEAETVAQTFFERWIVRHSAPETLVTDQGKEFCNKVLDEMCNFWQVEKRRTGSYRPQSNSSAESFNRSLRKYLLAMLDNKTTLDWEPLLPCLMLAYNCHVHRSTKESPFFLTYMHDPRLPYFDLEKPRTMYGQGYVQETFTVMQRAYEAVRVNLECAKKTQKEFYDRKASARTFLPGDKVMFFTPKMPVGANTKFYKFWQKAEVIRMAGNLNVVLKNEEGKQFIVHLDRVQIMKGEEEDAVSTPQVEVGKQAKDETAGKEPEKQRPHTRSRGPVGQVAFLDNHEETEYEKLMRRRRREREEEEEQRMMMDFGRDFMLILVRPPAFTSLSSQAEDEPEGEEQAQQADEGAISENEQDDLDSSKQSDNSTQSTSASSEPDGEGSDGYSWMHPMFRLATAVFGDGLPEAIQTQEGKVEDKAEIVVKDKSEDKSHVDQKRHHTRSRGGVEEVSLPSRCYTHKRSQ